MPSPSAAGRTLTWVATSTGGLGQTLYQFWRLDGNVWHLVQDYSTSRSFSWTPGIADIGNHALQVWARNPGSLAPYDVFLGTAFAVASPQAVRVVSLQPSRPLPVPAGSGLGWLVSAEGGLPPLEYQFWRLDSGMWKMVQDYGQSAQYFSTPQLADVGEHGSGCSYAALVLRPRTRPGAVRHTPLPRRS